MHKVLYYENSRFISKNIDKLIIDVLEQTSFAIEQELNNFTALKKDEFNNILKNAVKNKYVISEYISNIIKNNEINHLKIKIEKSVNNIMDRHFIPMLNLQLPAEIKPDVNYLKIFGQECINYMLLLENGKIAVDLSWSLVFNKLPWVIEKKIDMPNRLLKLTGLGKEQNRQQIEEIIQELIDGFFKTFTISISNHIYEQIIYHLNLYEEKLYNNEPVYRLLDQYFYNNNFEYAPQAV